MDKLINNYFIYFHLFWIYIYICERTVGSRSAVFIAHWCPWATNPIPPWLMAQDTHRSSTNGKGCCPHCSVVREISIGTTNPKGKYTQAERVQPIHRLSAVRSRWAYGGPTYSSTSSASWSSCPTTSRELGANGGGLTTRRCRRRTSRAATTQTFPSERNAAPAQAINDTPGSQESGGGGTMSYRPTGSIASTSSFTVVNQADVVRGGSARRATSARSPRAARSRIAEDGGGRSPSGAATREDEAGKSTTSSKRKP